MKALSGICALTILSACSLMAQTVIPEDVDSRNPYFFIKNQGQFPSQVKYQVELIGGRLYLENNRFLYDFYDNNDLHDRIFHGDTDDRVKCHAYAVNFVGSNVEEVTSSKKRKEIRNYYIGNDQSKWASGVPLYDHVTYDQLYPGIDLHFYGKDMSLKYDFIVAPEVDPDQIEMDFEGVDKLKIEDGNLVVQLSFRNVIEQAPIAYQIINGVKEDVAVEFVKTGKRITFRFPNGYDHSKELIIDPTLVFSTYTGSTADNWGFTATYDDSANHYAGGVVFAQGYPTTLGAYDTSFNSGGRDISITKFNPTGTQRIYSTYLGGNNIENPHSLVVNSNYELIVFGISASTNFPTNLGYDLTHNGGNDIIVARFDLNGGNIRSTYIGGSGSDGENIGVLFTQSSIHLNYGDNSRGEVIVDANDNVYIASCTKSTNFPLVGTPSPLQSTLGGKQDGVILRLTPDLSSLTFSTYLGGTEDDACFGLKLDQNNNVFTAGATRSSNFPTTTGVLHQSAQGSNDGFISHVNLGNSSMIASTFIGTSSIDQCYFLEIDSDEDVYVFGQTYSNSYPVTSGVYFNAQAKQFITKLNKSLTQIVFSTTVGSVNPSVPNISPTAFLVDNCEYLYISGWGGSVNSQGNTNGMPVTASTAYQTTTDGSDLYFMVLEKDAVSLDYGSYMGGSTTAEHVDGGTSRFDKKAVVYQSVCAGCGGSSAFPTTSGVVSPTNQASNCNLAAIKIDFPLPGIQADFQIQPSTSGCAPHNVNFVNTSSILLGTSYYWDYGDGTTSTSFQPNHNYPTPGQYTVMLVVSDPNSCNPQDTIYKTIDVFATPVVTTSPDTIVCAGQAVTISATGGGTYSWTPTTGLGSPGSAATTANPPSNTTYQVLVTNANGCQDSATVQVDVFPTAPTANAGNDTTICFGDTATLNGSGGTGAVWTPNNTLSNDTIFNPTAFPLGTQTYTLNVKDINGCADQDQVTVTVSSVSAGAGPDQDICIGQSTNLAATGGGNYQWTPPLALTNPGIANPGANPTASQTYTVLVTNQFGCTDIDSMRLTVNPLPIVNAGPDDTICLNETAILSASGANTYTWNPGGTGGTITVQPTQSTNYILTGTDNNNCQNDDTVNIEVLPLPPADAGPIITICEDSVGALAATGGVSYAWSPPIGLSDPTSPSPTASPPSTTNYTVVVTGANGCQMADTTTVNVIPTPILVVGPGKGICLGESTRLGASGAWPLVWSTGDTATQIVVNPDTSTTYYVVGYNQGCPSEGQSVYVSVIDEFPIAAFTANPDSGWIPLTVQFTNQTHDATKYSWYMGDGTVTNEFEPEHIYEDSGRFKVLLIATNEHGCRDSAQHVIIVKGGFTIYVPNAFTPNGDNLNDFFSVEEIGVDEFNIKIFNRWGALIFESNDKDFKWDGRFHGEGVQEEVYVWKIKATSFMGHEVVQAGTVTVLR